MRESKFRGKAVEGTNGWIYGGYFKHQKNTPSPIGHTLSDSGFAHYILNSGFSDWGMPKPVIFEEVESESVGQFTGLHDKNGVEIYEDDILEVSVYEGQKEIIRIVFDDGCFCHIGYLSDLRTYPLRDFLFNGTKLKVVGNVHDNPELLEVAE